MIEGFDTKEILHRLRYIGRQFGLTVTGLNWTTIRTIGHVYQTFDAVYRFRFNIVGTVSVGISTLTLTIDDIVFKNIASYNQAITLAATKGENGFTVPNTGDITGNTTSNQTQWMFSGDVELDGKPALLP